MAGPVGTARSQGLDLKHWLPCSGAGTLAGDGWLHVWHADAFALPHRVMEACLTDADRARAAVFHREEDRVRSLASRSALRHLCAGYLGADPTDLAFSAGENGKPRLDGPHRASGLRFNLSHSGRHVLLAFANGVEVGVDVEVLTPIPDLKALIASVADPGEAASLHAEQDDAARLRRFLELWTAKEAVLKATGMGLGADPRTARFAAGASSWVLQRIDAGPRDATWAVWRAAVLPDAVGHAAAAGGTAEPSWFSLTA